MRTWCVCAAIMTLLLLDIRTTSGDGSGSVLDIRTTSATGSGTQLTARSIENDPPAPMRILFVGNSLTHGIEWRDADYFPGGWGMAASQADRDYVHRTQLLLAARTGQIPEIAVASLDLIYPQMFDEAKRIGQEFRPDVVVVELGDAAQQMTEAQYKATLKQVIGWYSPPAKLVVTGVWYVARLEAWNRDVAIELGAAFVPIHDLNVPENWPRDDCINTGAVCNHPSDRGHALIAERIVKAIDDDMEIHRVYLPWYPMEY